MGKPKKIAKSFFTENDIDNIYTSSMYFQILTLIAVSRFKWNNLPEGMDERFLEETILWNGSALVFFDELYGMLNLPYTSCGQLNYYHLPVLRQPYSVGTIDFPVCDVNDSVIVWNDYNHQTPIIQILELTKRLYNVTMSLDVNTEALRSPVIAECDETQRKTLEEMLNKRKNGEPLILGNKTLDLMRLQVLPLVTQPLVDSISVLEVRKKNIWNEALSYLGINNRVEKRERMIQEEALSNNMLNTMMRSIYLSSRQEACEQINRLFGTNINVEFRSLNEIAQITGLSEVILNE